MSNLRRLVTPPKQPDAEPVCLLTRDAAAQRKVSPEDLFASANRQDTLPNGAEFRFPASDRMWERVKTFVAEEGDCCPFFAFEQWQEGERIILRVTNPQHDR